jgi:hypothetical protein
MIEIISKLFGNDHMKHYENSSLIPAPQNFVTRISFWLVFSYNQESRRDINTYIDDKNKVFCMWPIRFTCLVMASEGL